MGDPYCRRLCSGLAGEYRIRCLKNCIRETCDTTCLLIDFQGEDYDSCMQRCTRELLEEELARPETPEPQ